MIEKIIYFFLPAYLANMSPPLAKKFKILQPLEKPVDFGKKFFGQPLLGNHKTWRGVIFEFLVALVTVFLQRIFFHFDFFKKISILDYEKINIFLFGFLISFGTVFGDLFFAFIKRRLKLKPGAPFLPFDQTNYVIGCFIFLEPFLKLGILFWIKLFLITFFLHIIVNYLGYLLKIHEAKW